MTEPQIRVKDADKVLRSFKKVQRELPKEITKQLRVLGKLVRDDAVERFKGIDAESASRYRVRVSKVGRVAVDNPSRKVTGAHPEYGPLQMRKAFIPALRDKEALVVAGLEALVEKVIRENDLK